LRALSESKEKIFQKIEKRLGIRIDIESLSRRQQEHTSTLSFNTQITKKGIAFFVDHKYKNKDVHLYVNDDFLLTVKVGSSASFKINKKNKMGKLVIEAVNMNEKIELRV